MEWWSDISGLNRAFYFAAAFFSGLFLWQFIASMIGLAGGDLDIEAHDIDAGDMDFDVDIDVDFDGHLEDVDAIDSTTAFKMLSLRAILAFCTMFTWATAMYIDSEGISAALLYGIGWGLAAWLIISLLVNWMRKLAETGNARLVTCVGTKGTVYLDIPKGRTGEVRVMVSGRITLVKARTAGDGELKSGTPIRVTHKIDNTTVEVESTASQT